MNTAWINRNSSCITGSGLPSLCTTTCSYWKQSILTVVKVWDCAIHRLVSYGFTFSEKSLRQEFSSSKMYPTLMEGAPQQRSRECSCSAFYQLSNASSGLECNILSLSYLLAFSGGRVVCKFTCTWFMFLIAQMNGKLKGKPMLGVSYKDLLFRSP